MGDDHGQLSLHEFTLIIGLKCVGNRTVVGGRQRLQEKFFPKFIPSTVPRWAVAECLRQKRFGADEEVLQLALL